MNWLVIISLVLLGANECFGAALISHYTSINYLQRETGPLLGLSAAAIEDGALLSLKPVVPYQELAETQDWVVDEQRGLISLKAHPHFVVSYANGAISLRDTLKKAAINDKWGIHTQGDGSIVMQSLAAWARNETVYISVSMRSGAENSYAVGPSPRGSVPKTDKTTFFSIFNPIPVYDYVIVGAGTAGALVAKRLSDRGFRVVVVEAGKNRDADPNIYITRNIRAVEQSSFYNFEYFTDPIANLAGQRVPSGVGKMWGGTSNHNGMLYERGLRYDWDLMEKIGGPHWNYNQSVSKLYDSFENYTGPLAGYGRNGELDLVDSIRVPKPLADPIINATRTVYPGFYEINTIDIDAQLGAATTLRFTMQNKGNGIYYREGSSSAFLNASIVDPLTGRGVAGRKLQVISEAFVTQLIFSPIQPKKVLGVEYIVQSSIRRVYAIREVILSAGAYNSPSILQRSGVGNCTFLESLDIPCLLDNPNVGKNLRDHMRIQTEVQFPIETLPYIVAVVQGLNTDGHLIEGRVRTAVAAAFTNPNISSVIQPDSKISILYATQIQDPNINNLFDLYYVRNNVPYRAPIVEFAAILLRPKCTGDVTIVTANPTSAPQINHNYLCDPADLAWSVQILNDVMKIIKSLRAYSPVYKALFPTEEMITDPATFARVFPSLVSPYRHPVGSLKMSPLSDGGVVDGNLCVHGLENLRVVDASIFPEVPSSNLIGSIYAVGAVAVSQILAGKSC